MPTSGSLRKMGFRYRSRYSAAGQSRSDREINASMRSAPRDVGSREDVAVSDLKLRNQVAPAISAPQHRLLGFTESYASTITPLYEPLNHRKKHGA